MCTHVAQPDHPRRTPPVRPDHPHHTPPARPDPLHQIQDITVQVQRMGTRVQNRAGVENYQTYRRTRSVSIYFSA